MIMKKSKFLTLLALPLLLGGLSSCGTDAKYKIGICQLVTHDALDAATQGFVDAVKEGLGDDVKIDLQNAAGDSATCTTIVNNFVSKKYSLIMANATPALQAASNATTTIPILGTSVTEYGTALSIKDFSGVTGFNVSGTSDLAPLDKQAEILHEIFPDANKVGLLYCSAEANSLYQVNEVEKNLKSLGLDTVKLSFADSNDIGSVLDRGIGTDKIDALFIPTDNTAAANAKTIDAKCRQGSKKIPVFAGEEGLCKECGAITLSISYYKIGKKTGEMAVDILKNGADITKMKIEYDTDIVKKYNADICTDLGITVPSDFVKIGE